MLCHSMKMYMNDGRFFSGFNKLHHSGEGISACHNHSNHHLITLEFYGQDESVCLNYNFHYMCFTSIQGQSALGFGYNLF